MHQNFRVNIVPYTWIHDQNFFFKNVTSNVFEKIMLDFVIFWRILILGIKDAQNSRKNAKFRLG